MVRYRPLSYPDSYLTPKDTRSLPAPDEGDSPPTHISLVLGFGSRVILKLLTWHCHSLMVWVSRVVL